MRPRASELRFAFTVAEGVGVSSADVTFGLIHQAAPGGVPYDPGRVVASGPVGAALAPRPGGVEVHGGSVPSRDLRVGPRARHLGGVAVSDGSLVRAA